MITLLLVNIITMSPSLINKMKLFDKDPIEYSKDTVSGFLKTLKLVLKYDKGLNFSARI